LVYEGSSSIEDLDNVISGSNVRFFVLKEPFKYCQSLSSCQCQSKDFKDAAILLYFGGQFLQAAKQWLLHIPTKVTLLTKVWLPPQY